MTIAAKPPAEVAIDLDLVRALLREQYPDLASLTLVDAGEGWDNRLVRVGEKLAVRMPRRTAAALLIEQEQRWLPSFAARLPLPIPVAVRTGRPGCGYPWHWSVVPWLPGESALGAPWDPGWMAVDLGRFLSRLHQPAPEDAPLNPWRGIPLADRDPTFRKQLEQFGTHVDQNAVVRLWDRAVSAPPWPRPPVWIHGDLHPGNLLVTNGRLSAVVDFGDLCAGDPATDLAVMSMLLPAEARAAFLESARGPFSPMDEHTRIRALGWALTLGLAYLSGSRDDETMHALGRAVVRAALDEAC